MNYEKQKYYIETTDSKIIDTYNEKDIVINPNNINKLFEKSEEFNEKINFIKEQLSNDKLKKSVSANLFNIIENIEKSIEVIDETIISNGMITN